MPRQNGCTTLLTLLMSTTVALAACGPARSAAQTMNDAPQAAAQTAATYKTSDGPVAPDWSLTTLDGRTFRLADHQGEVVVMFFMASWCVSCVYEAQALAQLHNQYADQGLTVVAINVEPQQNEQGLSQFRQLADNAAYTWVFDTEYTVTKLYEVQSLDSTVIIDRAGRIAYRDAFITPPETLAAEVEKWL